MHSIAVYCTERNHSLTKCAPLLSDTVQRYSNNYRHVILHSILISYLLIHYDHFLIINYLFIMLWNARRSLCVGTSNKRRRNRGEKINFSNFPPRATQKLLREFSPSFFSSMAYYSYQEVKQSTFHLDPFRRSWRVELSRVHCAMFAREQTTLVIVCAVFPLKSNLSTTKN